MIVTYVWKSRVDIEHYSVAYFNYITVFEVLIHLSLFCMQVTQCSRMLSACTHIFRGGNKGQVCPN